MADTPIDPLPYERLERLDTAIARLRYIIIALLIVMIAGFVFLGVQVTRANGRIDQLAGKVDGLDTALGVKFEAVNAKVELDLTAAGCRAQDDGSRDHGPDQSYSQEHRHLAAPATGASATGTGARTIEARARAAAEKPTVTAWVTRPPPQYLK